MPSYQDFVRLAEEKNLSFAENRTPTRDEKAQWTCNACNKYVRTSFRSLKARKYGCSCQRPTAKTEDDYHKLAQQLGIRFIGQQVPANIRTQTQWMGPSGTVVSASYNDLGYNHPTRDIKRKLGLLGASNV